MRELDDITGVIVDAALRIHRDLGPGLLESVYEAILARPLERRVCVERQRSVRFEYDGMVFEDGLRVDLVVDDRVIVEVKSVEQFARAHPKQLLTYLKAHESAGWSVDQLRRSSAFGRGCVGS